MSSEDRMIEAIRDQRVEMKDEFSKVEQGLTRLSEAVFQLTTAMTRSEERHSRTDEALKRIGSQLDDHESRIRKLEHSDSDVEGFKTAISAIRGELADLKAQQNKRAGFIEGRGRTLTFLFSVLTIAVAIYAAS